MSVLQRHYHNNQWTKTSR